MSLSRLGLLLLLLVAAPTTPIADTGLGIELSKTRFDLLETPDIRVAGAAPGSRVTLRARSTDRDGTVWTSRAVFLADAEGRVDVARMAPVEGTYGETDARGLLWSMVPVAEAEEPAYIALSGRDRTRKLRQAFTREQRLGEAPIRLTIEATAGTDTATVAIERWFITRAVTEEPLRHEVLRGKLYYPADRGPAGNPGVVTLAGSGGGLLEEHSRFLASHGFTVLAVGLFRYEDRPAEGVDIALEYVRDGADWLKALVGHDRIGLLGISYGSQPALLAPALFPGVAAATVALVPTHAHNQGVRYGFWPRFLGLDRAFMTVGGEALPYPVLSVQRWPYIRAGVFRVPTNIVGRDAYLDAWTSPEGRAAEIPVEKAGIPILLVSGTEDGQWPSSFSGDAVMARLAAHKAGAGAEHIKIEGAGHQIVKLPADVSWGDTFGVNPHPSASGPLFGVSLGTPADNARGQVTLWRETVRFLTQHLQEKGPVRN